MKVLFIGNSNVYYNDMPQIFRKLAQENGHAVEVFSVTKPGQTLAGHLNRNDEGYGKIRALKQEHTFDYCIMNDASTVPLLDPDIHIGCVKTLARWLQDAVKTFVLYVTIPREAGHPDLETYGWTPEGMMADMVRAADRAAQETAQMLGRPVLVSPAGENALSFGKKQPITSLYDPDRLHPSYQGSCLVALTHYQTIFGALPERADSLELPEAVLQTFLETAARG